MVNDGLSMKNISSPDVDMAMKDTNSVTATSL
jgi:hypothetical protein